MSESERKSPRPRARRAAAADGATEAVSPRPSQQPDGLEFAVEIARLLHDDKCEDVVVLDVRASSQVTDMIVLGNGTSERQMRSVLSHVEELGRSRGRRSLGVSADGRSTWVLLDFADVVVHLFEPQTRLHYDLETLWEDSRPVEWERADQKNRDRAGLGRAAKG